MYVILTQQWIFNPQKNSHIKMCKCQLEHAGNCALYID